MSNTYIIGDTDINVIADTPHLLSTDVSLPDTNHQCPRNVRFLIITYTLIPSDSPSMFPPCFPLIMNLFNF